MHLLSNLVGMALFGAALGAQATPTLINADLASGPAAFDALVVAGGGRVATQPLQFLQDGVNHWDFPDFTIRVVNGATRFVEDDYAGLRERGEPGALSGWAIGMSANEPAPMWGLSFDFKRPVNAFGLEVGDWGTCCYASALVIAFDGGATRQVATADEASDNPGWSTYGHFTNFVAAIDRSGSFERVLFYGSGVGEYLVAGGTIRYSALPVDPELQSAVPLPAGWTLVLLALASLAGTRGSARAARPQAAGPALGWRGDQR